MAGDTNTGQAFDLAAASFSPDTVAVVTGSAQGIGKAIAEALLKKGVKVSQTVATTCPVCCAADRQHCRSVGRLFGISDVRLVTHSALRSVGRSIGRVIRFAGCSVGHVIDR